MESPMPQRICVLRVRTRRLRSRIGLGVIPRRLWQRIGLALGLVALLRGFGPYYLNLSLSECAGYQVVICTNHATYRTLEHVLVMVTNRGAAAIAVEQDGDSGSVILTPEWQSANGMWQEAGLDPICHNYCRPSGGANTGLWYPPPPHTVQIPSGGSLTGAYVASPSASGRYRLVLTNAPSAELLHVTDHVIGGSATLPPQAVSLPDTSSVAVSAPFELVDNGDRFPQGPLPA